MSFRYLRCGGRSHPKSGLAQHRPADASGRWRCDCPRVARSLLTSRLVQLPSSERTAMLLTWSRSRFPTDQDDARVENRGRVSYAERSLGPSQMSLPSAHEETGKTGVPSARRRSSRVRRREHAVRWEQAERPGDAPVWKRK